MKRLGLGLVVALVLAAGIVVYGSTSTPHRPRIRTQHTETAPSEAPSATAPDPRGRWYCHHAVGIAWDDIVSPGGPWPNPPNCSPMTEREGRIADAFQSRPMAPAYLCTGAYGSFVTFAGLHTVSNKPVRSDCRHVDISWPWGGGPEIELHLSPGQYPDVITNTCGTGAVVTDLRTGKSSTGGCGIP